MFLYMQVITLDALRILRNTKRFHSSYVRM